MKPTNRKRATAPLPAYRVGRVACYIMAGHLLFTGEFVGAGLMVFLALII